MTSSMMIAPPWIREREREGEGGAGNKKIATEERRKEGRDSAVVGSRRKGMKTEETELVRSEGVDVEPSNS
jgi:hypothetical protein